MAEKLISTRKYLSVFGWISVCHESCSVAVFFRLDWKSPDHPDLDNVFWWRSEMFLTLSTAVNPPNKDWTLIFFFGRIYTAHQLLTDRDSFSSFNSDFIFEFVYTSGRQKCWFVPPEENSSAASLVLHHKKNLNWKCQLWRKCECGARQKQIERIM